MAADTKKPEMTKQPDGSDPYLALVERFGRDFGAPLPKRLLEIGDPDRGWGVQLNPTTAAIGDVHPFGAVVTWNGWPAGILDPRGGIIAAGEAANMAALVEWLRSDPAAVPSVPASPAERL